MELAFSRMADPDPDEAARQFAADIAAIHGLDGSASNLRQSGGVGMDTRQAEMLAMFRAFLGPDYDRAKARRVLGIQSSLHSLQERLLDTYEAKEISAEEYVDSFNEGSRQAFLQVEDVLGTFDFERLFGAGVSEAAGYIDRDAFLRAETSAGR